MAQFFVVSLCLPKTCERIANARSAGATALAALPFMSMYEARLLYASPTRASVGPSLQK